MPKISVIVPIYNTAQYLEKCLLSIMRQSFQDIEILCIDDCSPDDSVTIVERLAAIDKRIHLLRHKENLGLGGARNTGIMTAKGAYLASVDSDDYVHPDMLTKLWEATKNQTVDVVVYGYAHVDNYGNLLNKVTYHDKAVPKLGMFSLNPSFCNKLWRKNLYIDNSIFFPNHVFYEDLATTPRVVHFAKKIEFISDVLYYYCERKESIVRTYSEKHIIDYLKVFDILYDFLIEYDLCKKDFLEQFHIAIRFHSSNIFASNMNDNLKTQYLRHLLLVKTGFNSVADNYLDFMSLDKQTLRSTLCSPWSMQQMKHSTFEYKNCLHRKISYKLFKLLFFQFMNENSQKLLEDAPATYLTTAKHPVARFFSWLILTK